MKMSRVFMNSENSNVSDAHKLKLNLRQKVDLRRYNNGGAIKDVGIYCTWKKNLKTYKRIRFRISGTTLYEEFELPDGSHSISDIQDCKYTSSKSIKHWQISNQS